MKLTTTLGLLVVVAILSAVVTKYYFPRIETQTVETTKEIVKTDIVTVTKIIENKDGSKETTTTTTDHTSKNETSSSSKTVAATNKDWMVSVSGDIKTTTRDQYYELQVQRRILGPFYLGAKASTNQTVGVSVGFEF